MFLYIHFTITQFRMPIVILFCDLFKVSIRFLAHVPFLAYHSVPVDLLQDSLVPPTASLHDVGIRDPYSVLDGSGVVPQVMEPEVWKTGIF